MLLNFDAHVEGILYMIGSHCWIPFGSKASTSTHNRSQQITANHSHSQQRTATHSSSQPIIVHQRTSQRPTPPHTTSSSPAEARTIPRTPRIEDRGHLPTTSHHRPQEQPKRPELPATSGDLSRFTTISSETLGPAA